MQTAPLVVSSLLILLSHAARTHGLCNLENGTLARCHELADVKYITTYSLESLKASVMDGALGSGFFDNLATLKHLDLSGGELKHIEPGAFRNLRELRSLDLADNHIEYLELASLDGLNQLRSLNLRRNNLEVLPPVLARLKNLRHLDVHGNPFQCTCTTLKVRDLLAKRGVKLSKRVVCAGPSSTKGVSMLKPEAPLVCAFEEQDREMQGDQPFEGSGEEDLWDENDNEPTVEPKAGDVEVETPAPETSEVVTPLSTEAETPAELETPAEEETTVKAETPVEEEIPVEAETPASTDSVNVSKEPTEAPDAVDASPTKTTDDDDLFIESGEKKDSTSASTTTMASKVVEIKDALFYPVEGSGAEEEEGSGSEVEPGLTFTDWSRTNEETAATSAEPSTTAGESIFDIFLSVFWTTTAAPEPKKDLDLEEEEFIDVSSARTVAVEEEVATKKAHLDDLGGRNIDPEPTASTTTSTVLLVDSEARDMSKSGKVKVEPDDGDNDEMAEVSPARQSKKGMGSYVVLAALLAVLAALIGFAAYKGDFCRKRRKRNDVEAGTELKDMQKALLDGGNAAQPKVSSNGNAESVPLVEGRDGKDDVKDTKDTKDTASPGDKRVPRSSNGTADLADPVKPPRKTYQPEDSGLDDASRYDSARTSPVPPSATTTNGLTTQPAEPDGPPLSPGAQRVKITLQENPDSVPRTPILITRTTAGENLVKTP